VIRSIQPSDHIVVPTRSSNPIHFFDRRRPRASAAYRLRDRVGLGRTDRRQWRTCRPAFKFTGEQLDAVTGLLPVPCSTSRSLGTEPASPSIEDAVCLIAEVFVGVCFVQLLMSGRLGGFRSSRRRRLDWRWRWNRGWRHVRISYSHSNGAQTYDLEGPFCDRRFRRAWSLRSDRRWRFWRRCRRRASVGSSGVSWTAVFRVRNPRSEHLEVTGAFPRRSPVKAHCSKLGENRIGTRIVKPVGNGCGGGSQPPWPSPSRS
jgi:hypothetical protein